MILLRDFGQAKIVAFFLFVKIFSSKAALEALNKYFPIQTSYSKIQENNLHCHGILSKSRLNVGVPGVV